MCRCLRIITIALLMAGSAFAQSTGTYTYAFPRFSSLGVSQFVIGVLGGQPGTFQGVFYDSTGQHPQAVYFETSPGFVFRVTPAALKANGVTDYSGGAIFTSPIPLSIVETIGDASGNFENVAPSVHSSQLILPFSEGTFGAYEISIFNAENANTPIIIAAIGTDGQTLGTAQRTLAPHAVLREFLDGTLPGLNQAGQPTRRDVSHVMIFTPTSILSNDKQLYAIASLTSYASAQENVFPRNDFAVINAVPAGNAAPNAAVPFFVQGGGYFSMVQVVNTTTTAGTVTLTARDTTGFLVPATNNPATFVLPPNGSIRFNTSNIFNFAQNVVLGSVTSNATVPTVVTSAIGTTNQLAFELSPGVTTTSQEFVFITNSDRTYFNGYALRNPNPSPTAITMRYILDDGTALSRITFSIDASSTLIKNLNELFPEASGNGYVLVDSSQPIMAEVIEGSVDGSQLMRIPTMQTQPGYKVPEVQRFLATGTVLHNGQPLAKAGVELSGVVHIATVTDALGTFTFQNIPPGTYTITPQLAGYTFAPAQTSFTIVNDNSRNNNFAATLVPPVIQSVNPPGILAGSTTTTITVQGGPFFQNSVVYFEGFPLPTVAGFASVVSAGTSVVSSGGTSGVGSSGGSGTGTGVSSSPNQLTATIDATQLVVARQGVLNVVNIGPGGAIVSAPVNFSIGTAAPSITGQAGAPVPLVAGNGGFTLTLTGSGFLPGAFGTVNGQPRSSTLVSSSTVQVFIPAQDLLTGAILQVAVSNPQPTIGLSNSVLVTVVNTIPGVLSITPNQAEVRLETNAPSLQITVNGFGFKQGASVLVGTFGVVPTTFVSSTQLIGALPQAAIQLGGVVPISVKNPDPTLGASEALPLFLSNLPPVLTTLETVPLTYDTTRSTETYPATVVMRGQNFSPSSVVELGTPCGSSSGFGAGSASYVSTQELVATVTIACTGTYLMRVRTPQPAGGVSQVLSFTVTAYAQPTPPSITGLSQSSVPAGSGSFTLFISGANFAGAAYVNFGTSILVPSSTTSSGVVVVVPAFLLQNRGVVPVSITNPNPTGTSNRVLFTIF